MDACWMSGPGMGQRFRSCRKAAETGTCALDLITIYSHLSAGEAHVGVKTPPHNKIISRSSPIRTNGTPFGWKRISKRFCLCH